MTTVIDNKYEHIHLYKNYYRSTDIYKTILLLSSELLLYTLEQHHKHDTKIRTTN